MLFIRRKLIEAYLYHTSPAPLKPTFLSPSGCLSLSFWPPPPPKLSTVIDGSQLLGPLLWHLAFVNHAVVSLFNKTPSLSPVLFSPSSSFITSTRHRLFVFFTS